ncbi:hypothetical protein CERSUDRAFT_93051 [Gelatoporia subvermispora B]|uniref:Uncharacterized protein n=1 Tax=Ceriporiopsis subvermispora (strain B) TaxID=914234 RepID=M2RKM8_CERS8|nr:hypothetical protein CERSUDRAFT_93051 [Gelatoporia subvermispora B]
MELCLLTGVHGTTRVGTVFHIVGSTSGFGYQRQDNVHFTSPAQYRGKLFLGSVAASQVAKMESLFRQVEIFNNDARWNCQNWVFAAVRKLVGYGFPVRAFANLGDMQAAMAAAWDDWESGTTSD